MQKQLLSVLIASTAAAGSLPSFAQEGLHSGGLEQIIVSARRVEENVQDVPLAITALSGEQLEKAGVKTLNDMAQAVPSVNVAMATGRSNASIFGIRGQKADDVLMTSDQAVGVYIGGVAQGWPYGVGLSGALDIASFEVAKGPQGTLFGKNTTGGAVIITPNEPVQNFEARMRAGAGNYSLRELEGMVNTPLTDTLALRVAASGTQRDGVFENKNASEDLNDRNDWNARASLKWVPTDALSNLLVVDQMQSSNHGSAVKVTGTNPNTAAGRGWATAIANYAGDSFYSAHQDADLDKQYQDTKVWGVANTTTFEITDEVSFKNILGFRQLDLHTMGDSDGVNRFDNPNGTPFRNKQFSEVSAVTEELQLIGSHNAADWILGMYYSRIYGEDGATNQTLSLRVSQTGPFEGIVNESVALFGQSTFHLTDDLNLTVGLRGTTDNRTAELGAGTWALGQGLDANAPIAVCSLRDASGTPLPANKCYSKRSESFHEPTYNLSLDYRLTADQLVYVAHRHGYRSGGIPGRGIDDQTLVPFKPEIVDDLELGYKLETDIVGMPLRVNTAAFYQDYKDVQKNITVFNSAGTTGSTVGNAGSATIQGLELEFTFLPIDSLTISGYMSYIDASYDEWIDGVTGRDFSSNKFSNVPEWQGNLNVRYQLPLPVSIGEVYASVGVYTQAETELSYENKATNCVGTHQDAYTLYNARVDWDNVMGVGNWQVAAWGKNLGEEKYFVSGLCFDSVNGYTQGYPAEPRTYGVNVTYTF